MFSTTKNTIRAGLAVLAVFASLILTQAAFAQATGVHYKPGTYTATADGKDGPVTVRVVFSASAIEKVTIVQQAETVGLGDQAIQSLAVDAVTGATMSSRVVGIVGVHAKKVILATGGYAGSADELAKHMNGTDYFTLAYANNVGDGIRLGLGVGANWQNIHTVAVHTTTIPSKDPKIWQGAAASLLGLPLMWVNREGKRFVGEDIVYDFALLGNVAVAQGGAYYTILDQKTLQDLTEKGSPLPGTMERTILVSIGLDTKRATGKTAPMKGLPAWMDETMKAGFAWKADSLDARGPGSLLCREGRPGGRKLRRRSAGQQPAPGAQRPVQARAQPSRV